MKRFLSLILAVLMIFALAACGNQTKAQDMDVTEILKDAEYIELSEGEVAEAVLNLPEIEGLEVKFDASEGIKLTQEDGVLKVTGDTEGEYAIKVTLSAEGYNDKEITIPVKVTGGETIEATLEDICKDAVTFEEGKDITVDITLPEIEGLTATAEASEGATAVLEGGKLKVAAEKAGSYVVDVKLSAEGYKDLTVSIPVKVTEKAAASGETETSGTSEPTSETPAVQTSAPTKNLYQNPNKSFDTSDWDDNIMAMVTRIRSYRVDMNGKTLDYIPAAEAAAMLRASEAPTSHKRPNGTDWTTVFSELGLNYNRKAELFFSLESEDGMSTGKAFNTWKATPEDNAKLLSEDYTGMGVGLSKIEGVYYIVVILVG